MNRRSLFSFLATAPVGAVMAAKAATDANGNPIVKKPKETCHHCGHGKFHHEPRSAIGQYPFWVAANLPFAAVAVCSNCRYPWHPWNDARVTRLEE